MAVNMIKFICALIGHPLKKDGWHFSLITLKLERYKCPICDKDYENLGE